MELEHSFTVPVPEERAWEVLLDVERVAPCMPGAALDSVDGDAIHGRIKVKVGPIAMTYAGTARFTERDPHAHVVTLEASGKETRGAGTASATVRSVLDGQGDHTHVIVRTTLNVTGRPAQFGRGVMAEVGGKLIGIFAANLAQMLTADQSPAAAEGAAANSGVSASFGTRATASEGSGQGADASADAAAGSGQVADASADAAAATGEGFGQGTGFGEGADGGLGDRSAGDLAQPVEELQLSLRSYNSLRREGIHTIGDLATRTREDLLAIDNIGPASVDEIKQKLAARGLSLSESPASADGLPPGGPAVAGQDAAGQPTVAGQTAARQDTAGQDTAAGQTAANQLAPEAASPSPAPQLKATPPVPPRLAARPPDDDAIDLLSVAGIPVLKRALPVAAASLVSVLVVVGLRRRRRQDSS